MVEIVGKAAENISTVKCLQRISYKNPGFESSCGPAVMSIHNEYCITCHFAAPRKIVWSLNVLYLRNTKRLNVLLLIGVS